MKVYAVRWRQDLFFNLYDDASDFQRPWPARTRLLRLFMAREQAEAFRLEWERVRTPPGMQANPFAHLEWSQDLDSLTSLPELALGDWVREVGLEPPGPAEGPYIHSEHYRRVWDWQQWWEDQKPTDAQKAHIHRALDRLDFLEVVELELDAAQAEDGFQAPDSPGETHHA